MKSNFEPREHVEEGRKREKGREGQLQRMEWMAETHNIVRVSEGFMLKTLQRASEREDAKVGWVQVSGRTSNSLASVNLLVCKKTARVEVDKGRTQCRDTQ